MALRRPGRLRTVPLMVMLAASGACDSGDASRESAPPTTEAPRETTSTSPPVPPGQTEVALPHESGSVVLTDAGVWVFPHLDAVALRVDESGEVEREVELPAYATAAAGGDGMLWVRTENDEQSYTRLDPSTGEVVGRITDVPGDAPIVAHGFLWAAGQDGTLFRVDAEASRADRFRVQSQGPFLIAATRTKVWSLGVDGLVGVDPASGATTAPWRPIGVLGQRPEQMASGGERLLFATPGAVSEVDPEARTKAGEVAAPAGTRPLAPATRLQGTDPQLLWAFHRYEESRPSPPRGSPARPVTLARLDLESGTIASSTETAFPEFQGLATDGQKVWVAPLRERRLLHLELR